MSASHYQELGHPYVQTCIPSSYAYLKQYNSIVQDDQGLLYVGARNGILVYNGFAWKHISAHGNIYLVRKGDRILANTATGQWILLRNKKGRLELAEKGTDTGDEEGTIRKPLNRDALGTHQDPSTPSILSENYDITCSVRLSTGHWAFGTKDKGIGLATDSGLVIRFVGIPDGLYSNRIIDLLVDQAGNLWALHQYALSRIEFPSAFSIFDSRNGLEGNVNVLLRNDGMLFAGTNRGLYRLIPPELKQADEYGNAKFLKIEGIDADCRCLAGHPGGVFVGSSGGLYHHTSKETRKILPDPVNALCYVSSQNILLAGTDSGLRILSLGNPNPDNSGRGQVNSKGNDLLNARDPESLIPMSGTAGMAELEEIVNFSLPKVSIDAIGISPMGILWLSSRSGALYQASRTFKDPGNLSFISYTSEDLKDLSVSFINLITVPGKLYFSGLGGLFTFDARNGSFEPDSLIKLPDGRGRTRIRTMEAGPEGGLWVSFDRPEKAGKGTWSVANLPDGQNELVPLVNLRLNNTMINCLLAEEEKILWIGTSEGLWRYDPAMARQGEPVFQSHFTSLQLGTDPPIEFEELQSPDFAGTLIKDRLVIPRSKNYLRISFASTDFTCTPLPSFQYLLKGRDDDWSDWARDSFLEFRNLKRGNYQILLRSRDNYGSISEPAVFGFRIRAPFYGSWYAFLFYALFLILAVFGIRNWIRIEHLKEQYHLEEVVQERTESLIKEKEKTEDLLANILPKTTADELKTKGKATTSKFKMATVLFADIQGFTKIAEEMNPDTLIDQLDRFYFHFDSVVEKYNIEKIKTIGDAYMAAGGIPIKNRTNPVEVVLAALEMQQHMKELKASKSNIWDLRIGIHTGSVIAGVVGQKKYSYDIWGDTVNTASRMESSGEAGRVNISATTYKLIKDFFQCEYRGKMPVKYKGDIAMFFVNGINPTFSEADRITPNSKFWIQVQLLRLLDLEEMIIEKLEKELPEDLFFHNVEHTSHVYAQVELLGRGEKVGEEDLLLLRTAALMHDTGYIDRMDDHESRSVEYAREILPLYRYSEEQIEKVCQLVMASVNPPNPENLLEEILCDANLDHLGRVDFLIQSDKLFQEYRVRNKVKSKKEWNQYQIDFLTKHEFYTSIARRMREVSKKQQIENIKQFS